MILDELDGHQLLVLVIETLDDLSKGSLANDLDELEAVSNVVAFLDTVVALLIVVAVVHEALHVRRLDLLVILTEVVQLLVIFDFGQLGRCEVLVGDRLAALGVLRLKREVDVHVRRLVDGEFLALRGLRDHRRRSMRKVLARRSDGRGRLGRYTGDCGVST